MEEKLTKYLLSKDEESPGGMKIRAKRVYIFFYEDPDDENNGLWFSLTTTGDLIISYLDDNRFERNILATRVA